jgi:hypothetical protein
MNSTHCPVKRNSTWYSTIEPHCLVFYSNIYSSSSMENSGINAVYMHGSCEKKVRSEGADLIIEEGKKE